jgi:hypothetical protein
MRTSLLVFRLPPGTPNRELGKFVKKLYGQETSSWSGKYSYRRPGLLDGVAHRKLLRGVLIVQERDAERVLKFLRDWKAQVEVRSVRPNEEDVRILERIPSAQGGGR